MSDSYITVKNEQITSYVGDDATTLFQAKCVIMSLKAIKSGMRLSRNATPSNTLALASQFSGKRYKRGQYDEAINDVQQWVNTMNCAMPIVVEDAK